MKRASTSSASINPSASAQNQPQQAPFWPRQIVEADPDPFSGEQDPYYSSWESPTARPLLPDAFDETDW